MRFENKTCQVFVKCEICSNGVFNSKMSNKFPSLIFVNKENDFVHRR
jgi:hypothetical protein